MDINKRKSRVINLRKKKIMAEVPRKIEVSQPEVTPAKITPRTTTPELCYQCGSGNEDNLRCGSCEAKHQELVVKLDSRPREKVEKIREKEYPFYSVKGGVQFTDWYTAEDLRTLGIPIPKE